MIVEIVALAAGALVAYGLVSARLEHSVVTPPMAFVLLGLALGPAGFGLVALDVERPALHALAELTLVVILFTDASRIDLRALRREWTLPERMLTIGLPLAILAGAGAGLWLLDGLGFWQVAVIAAVLAPTDAALAQAVLAAEEVPARVRQTINVESGLNDGIALPAVLVLLAATGAAVGGGAAVEGVGGWALLVAMQLVLGPAIGVAAGWGGGRLLEACSERGWVSAPFVRLSGLGIALLAFAAAEVAGGNGFLAAFLGGLAFGNSARSVCPAVHLFGETEGQLLALVVFMVFGIAMAPVALDAANWTLLAYAGLSLTVVRMAPIALSLIGSGLRADTVLFLGWFGPRGVASILFSLLVVQQTEMFPAETMAVVYLTVLISVFAHGLTAHPLAAAFGRRMGGLAEALREAESRAVAEMPLRIGGRSRRRHGLGE